MYTKSGLTAANPSQPITPPVPGPRHCVGVELPHLPHPRMVPAPPPIRWAGLVDIEDLLMGKGGRRAAAQGLDPLLAIKAHLRGMPVRLAAGEWVFRACMPELALLGWGLEMVPAKPDAADIALAEAGQSFAGSGVTDLVIVSGDHAFASLASVARLHVIARRECLSRQLRLAATTITYLPALQNHTHEIA